MSNKNYFNIIIAVTVISLTLYLFLGNRKRQKLLSSDEVHYSIGTIISFEKGAKVAPWLNYEFYDGEKIVKGQYSLAKKPELSIKKRSILEEYIGEKFLIKFASNNSNFSELYFEIELPDSLKQGTERIWESNPLEAKIP